MKRLLRLAAGFAVAAGVVPLVAGPASGHTLSSATITCSAVSGTFDGFNSASSHPIVWHIAVGAGSFQAVTTTESPPNFVGSGTATADISALTDQLHAASATVKAFATWPTGQSATESQVLTCGTPEVSPLTFPPTTLQPQVSAGEATAPVSPLASPASAVPGAAPRFTG